MITKKDFIMAQIIGSATRAICAAVQASGPACNLPKIERGREPTADEYKNGTVIGFSMLSEDEVRKEVFGRSKAHLSFMRECIDKVGELAADNE